MFMLFAALLLIMQNVLMLDARIGLYVYFIALLLTDLGRKLLTKRITCICFDDTTRSICIDYLQCGNFERSTCIKWDACRLLINEPKRTWYNYSEVKNIYFLQNRKHVITFNNQKDKFSGENISAIILAAENAQIPIQKV